MAEKALLMPSKVIENKIFLVRGKKVMFDRDLAALYGVMTGNLNKAVSRNIERFPDDFMFQLTKEEFENLIFHFGRSSWGGTRKLPRVFTENGVAMLSSVLNSEKGHTGKHPDNEDFYKTSGDAGDSQGVAEKD